MSGGKPIRFRGSLLVEASSWTTEAPVWHEIVLYERDTMDYIAGIKTCRSPASNDVFHATAFGELESVLTWIEEFDPMADLVADLDASDRRISTTDIALRAAALRQRADRVVLQYRTMVGEILYRIDLGE
jgi:hypothetical protein